MAAGVRTKIWAMTRHRKNKKHIHFDANDVIQTHDGSSYRRTFCGRLDDVMSNQIGDVTCVRCLNRMGAEGVLDSRG